MFIYFPSPFSTMAETNITIVVSVSHKTKDILNAMIGNLKDFQFPSAYGAVIDKLVNDSIVPPHCYLPAWTVSLEAQDYD